MFRSPRAQDPNPRPTCLRCRRALSACWCESSTSKGSRAELVFLQHPRESQNPIGTARMAHLAVLRSLLRVGIEFEADPVVTALRGDTTRRSVVLYPSPKARPAEELRSLTVPLRVFVLDGTWWQAKKLWQRNPWLHALPAYRLTPSTPGQYRIRKEPAAHCLATIESVVQLLDVPRAACGRCAGRAGEGRGGGRFSRSRRKAHRPDGRDGSRVGRRVPASIW